MGITQNPVDKCGWKFLHKSIPIVVGFLCIFLAVPPPRPAEPPPKWGKTVKKWHKCVLLKTLWADLAENFTTSPYQYRGWVFVHFFWRCLCLFRRNHRRNEEKTVKNWHKCVLLETLWTEFAENFNTIPYRYCLGFCVFFQEVPPSLPAEPPPKWWKTVKNWHNGVLLKPCGRIWPKI